MIGRGVRPGGAGAERPGRRLARVIAGRQQRMMPVAFEVRLRQFLVAVSLDDGRVQPDAGGALHDPVRDPDRRQAPGLRPRVPPGPVHRGGDLAATAAPPTGPPSDRSGPPAPAAAPAPHATDQEVRSCGGFRHQRTAIASHVARRPPSSSFANDYCDAEAVMM